MDKHTRECIAVICSEKGESVIKELSSSDPRLADLVQFVLAVKEASRGLSMLDPFLADPNGEPPAKRTNNNSVLKAFIRECAFNVFMQGLASFTNTRQQDQALPNPSNDELPDGPQSPRRIRRNQQEHQSDEHCAD
jgi:hypothetical protein